MLFTLQRLYNLRQATAAPHYSQIRICKFIYSRIFITLNQYLTVLLMSFWDMHRVVKILSRPVSTFPAEVERENALPSCFSSHTINRCLVHGLCTATFPYLNAFCLWFPRLKLASSGVDCGLEILSDRRLSCALRRTRVLQAWVSAIAMSSVSMNQQHIWNKVFLNRNAHETMLCIDWLADKKCWSQWLVEPSPEFPLRAMVQHLLIQGHGRFIACNYRE